MAILRKPFRTLKSPVGAPDHFTVEQADAAVLAVMAERGETPVFDPVEGTSAGTGLDPRQEITMVTRRKPLRTLKEPVGAPDHFTVEQARAAVLAVMTARGEIPRPDVMEPAVPSVSRRNGQA